MEGAPLRLLVSLLIFSVTSPMVWSSFEDYDIKRTSTRIESELSYLAVVAGQYCIAGGGAEDIDLNLERGYFSSLLYAKIGDKLGTVYSRAIRYKIEGLSEETIVVEGCGGVSSPGNKSLELSSGSWVIHLESDALVGRPSYLEVSLVI